MYSHNMVGSNDLEASKKFYDATFQAIGGTSGTADPKGRLVYTHAGSRFLVTKPIDGKSATAGNGCTVGFSVESPEQGDAWHKAGLQAGGVTVEDPPGIREADGVRMYRAYLRDPSGNKLCVVHRL